MIQNRGLYSFTRSQFENEPETHAFCVWAFGEGYETELVSKLNNRWNDRHKEALFVADTDGTHESILKMVSVYKQTLQ